MASVIKVDQIQSDTGTVNVASNIRFTGTNSMSFGQGQGLKLGDSPITGQVLSVDGNIYLGNNGNKVVGVHSGYHNVISADADVYIISDVNLTSGSPASYIYLGGGSNFDTDSNTAFNYDSITLNRQPWMTLRPEGVLMPRQPAFCAHRSATFTMNSSGNQDIVCDTVVTNIGSNYNNSTGRFTAPLTGTYFFSMSVSFDMGDGTDDTGGITFGKNGTALGNGVNGSGTQFHQLINPQRWTGGGLENGWNFSAILTLNAGDYITPKIMEIQATNVTVPSAVFSGFLIG